MLEAEPTCKRQDLQAGGVRPTPHTRRFPSFRCCADSGVDVDGSAGVFGNVVGVIGSVAGGVLGFHGVSGVSRSGGVAGGSTSGLSLGASTEEDSVLEGAPAPAVLEVAPPSDVSGGPPPALKAPSTDSASALEVAVAPVEAALMTATVSSLVAWAATQGAVRVVTAAAGSSVVEEFRGRAVVWVLISVALTVVARQ